eukprot:365508-Chlamydomonas_euryale.AAC.8
MDSRAKCEEQGTTCAYVQYPLQLSVAIQVDHAGQACVRDGARKCSLECPAHPSCCGPASADWRAQARHMHINLGSTGDLQHSRRGAQRAGACHTPREARSSLAPATLLEGASWRLKHLSPSSIKGGSTLLQREGASGCVRFGWCSGAEEDESRQDAHNTAGRTSKDRSAPSCWTQVVVRGRQPAAAVLRPGPLTGPSRRPASPRCAPRAAPRADAPP